MTCERYETEIALLVSGDLPERKARKVQRHVDECVTCQALHTEFREGQTALRALRESGIDRDLKNTLHERVLGAVDPPDHPNASPVTSAIRVDDSRRRRPGFVLSMAYAGLAVVISCAVVVGWTMREAKPHINAPVQTAMAPAGSSDPSRSGSQISDPPVTNSTRGNSQQSTVVRMYTDDPRVVFFLVSNQTGG